MAGNYGGPTGSTTRRATAEGQGSLAPGNSQYNIELDTANLEGVLEDGLGRIADASGDASGAAQDPDIGGVTTINASQVLLVREDKAYYDLYLYGTARIFPGKVLSVFHQLSLGGLLVNEGILEN